MTDWYESPCDHTVGERPESFTLTIDCENDSFNPYWYLELARLLNGITAALLAGESIPTKLRDHNGNTVGKVSIN